MLSDLARLTHRSEARYENPRLPEPLIQVFPMSHASTKLTMIIIICLEKGAGLFWKSPGSKIRAIWVRGVVRDGRRWSLNLKMSSLSKL